MANLHSLARDLEKLSGSKFASIEHFVQAREVAAVTGEPVDQAMARLFPHLTNEFAPHIQKELDRRQEKSDD